MLKKRKENKKMDNVIEVSHLTKDYGYGRGVFDVSFSVKKGEVFGFLGPNGAGKSTTIRHLMGFSKPGSGLCKIFEKESFNEYFNILQHVGYIPGEIALPQGLTGYEFIKMMQDLQGIHNQEMLDKLLNMFELDDVSLKGDTKHMSLGVKRKLAIVTAFMSDPNVLILDEPTSGLDPVMQEVFINFIKEEKKNGKTILLSSHIFSEIDATCDRIAIIKDGKIVSEFIADDLKHAELKRYQLFFKDENSYSSFIAKEETNGKLKILDKNPSDNNVLISIHDKDINYLINSLTDYSLIRFTNIKETLEDYFMKFYKEDKDFGGVK